MDSIDGALPQTLRQAKRLAVIGVGSVLMADDAAGSEIASRLRKKYGRNPFDDFRVFDGGNAPENFTGAIREFRPDRVVIIDAADFKAEPGSVSIIDSRDISGVSFSTHTLPLKFLAEYLENEIGCAVTVIGIQPADLTFGAPMTPCVKKAVKHIAGTFAAWIRQKECHSI